jgi:hypothetical protein
MAVVAVTTKMVAGVKYSLTTADLTDWPSVPNSTYFYDLATEIVYYKNSSGTVINPFENSGSSYIRRHQTTANYDYLGYAVEGTLESDTTWNLTRLTLDSSGISAVMTATDSWDNRVTATYI